MRACPEERRLAHLGRIPVLGRGVGDPCAQTCPPERPARPQREEDEGLQLMSLATSSEARDQGSQDSNDQENLRRQQQRLAVDSSELVLQWYQQHVQSTSTQEQLSQGYKFNLKRNLNRNKL